MNKFIITKNGELKLGNVDFHFNLLPKGDISCYGGGFYFINEENKTLELSGKSMDFGKPDFEKLKTVPILTNIGDDYSITYEGKKLELKIEREKQRLESETINKNSSSISKKSSKFSVSNKNLHLFKINGESIFAKNKKLALKLYKKLFKK